MKNTFLFLSFFFTLIGAAQVRETYMLIDKKMSAIPVEKTQNTAEIARFISSNLKRKPKK